MKILVTIIAFVLATAIQAQDDGYYDDAVATYLAAKLHQDSIDVSDVVVVYNYSCKTFDADNVEVTDSTRLALQVGEHCTRFYPYSKYMEDTEGIDYFTADNYNVLLSDALCHIPEVWSNYPDGKMTVRDMIIPSCYETCEDIDRPKWTVWTDDTLTIQGYMCKTARCEYKGLGWTVRYTEDIPSIAGPWKLSGLPGLILEAESRDGIHQFKMEALNNVKTPIFHEYNAITEKVSEKRLISHRNKIYGNKLYPKNPMYYMTSRAGNDEVYCEFDGDLYVLINGAFALHKAHVFQPLEK